MKKIGILGGTFNPIHNGHIQMLEYSKTEADLDKVILMPTFMPPHKDSENIVSANHRLNMCRLACENLTYTEVSDLEIRLEDKSYTYRTLQLLHEMYPEDELYFIEGADMFLTMQSWKNPEVIFSLAKIIAVPRDYDSFQELKIHYREVLSKMGAQALVLQNPVLTVSSTYIRDNIDNVDLLKELIDKRVYDYINENNLYRV